MSFEAAQDITQSIEFKVNKDIIELSKLQVADIIKKTRSATNIRQKFSLLTDEELAIIEDPKNEKDKAANDAIIENLNDVRQLFELRKLALGGTSKNDPSEKGALSAEGLSIVKDKWKTVFNRLPMNFQQDWAGNTKQLYIQRLFKGRGFDRRAVNLISFMSDSNLILPDAEGNINIDSKIGQNVEFAKREATLTTELSGFAAGLNKVFDSTPWAKPSFYLLEQV